MISPVLLAARRYHAAGLSLLPIAADGSKRPDAKLLPQEWNEAEQRHKPTWKPLQARRPTSAEIETWFRSNIGIALICGAVSGNVEDLDFDEPGLYEEFEAAAADQGEEWSALVQRLPLAQTPSGGNHLFYRCETPPEGNQKLAMTRDRQTRIETRGEGGYAIVAPSPAHVHPDKRPYIMQRGDLADMPTLTARERAFLHHLAGLFNEWQPQHYVDAPKPVRRAQASAQGLSPGDDYNQRGDYESVLERHGWRRLRREGSRFHWRRPGKKEAATSATTGYEGRRMLYVFSSNAVPFEPEHGYSPFAVYALLEHGGDFTQAAKTLYADGYGERIMPKCSVNGTFEPLVVPTLPEPQALTLEEWEQHGKTLRARKQENDEQFRRASARWYAAEIKLPYGQKEAFTRNLFGEALFLNIKKWASAFKAWGGEWQEGIPVWVHQELQAQTPETREEIVTEFRKGGLTQKAIRAKVGTGEAKREPTGWQAAKQHYDRSFADLLVRAAEKQGDAEAQRQLKAFLTTLCMPKCSVNGTFESPSEAADTEKFAILSLNLEYSEDTNGADADALEMLPAPDKDTAEDCAPVQAEEASAPSVPSAEGKALLVPYAELIMAAQRNELSPPEANAYVVRIAEPIYFGETLAHPLLLAWLANLQKLQQQWQRLREPLPASEPEIRADDG